MTDKKPLQQSCLRGNIFARVPCFGPNTVVLLVLFALLAGHGRAWGTERGLTENQVKSLCLLNFAKYVVWPSESFPTTNAPIIIGVIAEATFEADLEKTVGGKMVEGREIVIHRFEKEADFGKYHMLFIGTGEKKRLSELLGAVKTLPLLTVGETEQFLEHGGIINFTKKEGKVRLEIDLNAARRGGLQISSKLLKVADLVRGK